MSGTFHTDKKGATFILMRNIVNIFRKRRLGTCDFHLWTMNDKGNGTGVG